MHLSYRSQAAELTDLRREFPFLAESSQTAQQQALRDLDRAFDRFFAGAAGYPKSRKRGVDDSARIQGRECRVRKLNAKWSEVSIPKIGWLRFRSTRPILGNLLNVTLSCSAVDGWHLSFAFELSLPALAANDDRPLTAADCGVVRTLALPDGTFRDMPVERLNVLERRRRRAQKDASRGRRGSKRNRRAKLKVARIAAKQGRVRRHWVHETTSEFAWRFSCVVLEDLRIANITKSAKGTVPDPGRNVRQKAGLNRSILNQCWGMFATVLEYKMSALGCYVAYVPAMNTSRECPRCGHCSAENRESQAVFRCVSCGLEGHADTVASVNILRRWNAPSSDVEAMRFVAVEACELTWVSLVA